MASPCDYDDDDGNGKKDQDDEFASGKTVGLETPS